MISMNVLEEMFDNADLLIKENRIADAINVLNDVLAEAPDFGKAHNHLGWIYETKHKDLAKAEEHYRLAIKFKPDYTAVYYNYAILLSTLRRYDELDALLKKAELCPGINRATLANEYGIMYESMGKYDEAISAYKNYIALLFDEKMIDTAAASIQRCKKKKEILSSI
jgi:Tfp pilus assembly protein PilF